MKFAGEMQKWDPTLPNAARNKDRSRFHLMPEIKILAEIKEITFSAIPDISYMKMLSKIKLITFSSDIRKIMLSEIGRVFTVCQR